MVAEKAPQRVDVAAVDRVDQPTRGARSRKVSILVVWVLRRLVARDSATPVRRTPPAMITVGALAAYAGGGCAAAPRKSCAPRSACSRLLRTARPVWLA
jgi:hypothetical protein